MSREEYVPQIADFIRPPRDSVQPDTQDRPLRNAIHGATVAITTVHQVVDEVYKRLDHLILHTPEPPQPDTISPARAASSDTVRLINNLEESAEAISERLRRLLSILEA